MALCLVKLVAISLFSVLHEDLDLVIHLGVNLDAHIREQSYMTIA